MMHRAHKFFTRSSGLRTILFQASAALVLVAPVFAQNGHVAGSGFGSEASGAGATLTDLDLDPRPELLLMAHDGGASESGQFHYRVGLNVSPNGVPAHIGEPYLVSLRANVEGAGMAAADLNGNGRPELILAGYANDNGSRQFRYRVGRDLSALGAAGSWTPPLTSQTRDHRGFRGLGAGVAAGRINVGTRPDVLFAVCEERPSGNLFRYTVAFDLDANGRAQSWSPMHTTPALGSDTEGAGCELVNLDNNGRLDLILYSCERSSGLNTFRYKIGWNLSPLGIPESWSGLRLIPGVGTRAQGGAVVARNLGANTQPEILLMAYDNPSGQNEFRWQTLRDADPQNVYPGRDVTGGWIDLGLSTRSGPAISGHGDNGVHVASIDASGRAMTRSSFAPNSWSAWSAIPGGPGGFASDTSPVFARVGTQLYLFARGSDNNLYFAQRGNSSWGAFTALTNDAPVAGRIDVTVTVGAGAEEVHAVFPHRLGGVSYERFRNRARVGKQRFAAGIDAGIGGDGANQIALAVRESTRVRVYNSLRGSGAWPLSLIGGRGVSGRGGGTILDVSNVEFFGDEIHVAYAQRYRPDDVSPGVVHAVSHTRFRLGQSDDFFTRHITHYAQAGTARVRIENYREKMVALWTEPSGAVQFARLDNMDPQMPWIGPVHVSRTTGAGRPGLVGFNHELQPQEFNMPNYGDDLFVVVRGPGAASRIRFNIASRAVLKPEISRAFKLYDAPTGAAAWQTQLNAPTPIDLSQEHRPILTEVGFNLWMLPHWLVKDLYPRTVRERFSSSWSQTGRVPSSSGARMPVIIKPNGRLIFAQGIYVNRSSSYIDIWEEMGHYACFSLGIENNASGPKASDAIRSGIPLSALQAAKSLFTERSGTCESGPRCAGFTGIGGNYDNTGREHSFLYTVYFYVHRGDDLRRFMAEDTAGGDTLLTRKYEWVKRWIFRGLEFDDEMKPVSSIFWSAGGGGDRRSAIGMVGGSTGPLTAPTSVDFGDLSGDATFEFFFNATNPALTTALAGNDAWALKLEQWRDAGVFGTTEFGVADNLFSALDGQSVDSVFESDVHVVFASDTAAGEVRLYINGAQVVPSQVTSNSLAWSVSCPRERICPMR